MAKKTIGTAGIWFGAYDVAGAKNKIMFDVGGEAVDVSNFGGAGWMESLPTVRGARFAFDGFFDQPIEGAEFAAIGGTDQIVTIAPDGVAQGSLAYSLRAMLGSWKAGGAVKAPLGAGIAGSLSTAPPFRGVLLDTATRTATANGTITQVAAVPSGQKARAALHVLAASGTTPSLTVSIQSAALVGFGSPTTRMTFNAATGIGAQWAESSAGPITDQFWRAVWTITGTSPSFTAVLSFGIA